MGPNQIKDLLLLTYLGGGSVNGLTQPTLPMRRMRAVGLIP
jgi:hypothetical protein